MVFEVQCSCNAKFEINSNVSRVKEEIKCPSCGKAFPAGATKVVKECFSSLDTFESMLESIACEVHIKN